VKLRLLSAAALLFTGCQHRTPAPTPAAPPSPAPAATNAPVDQPAPRPSLPARMPVPAGNPQGLPVDSEAKLDASLIAITRAFRGGPEAVQREVAAASLDEKDHKIKVQVIAADAKFVPDLKAQIAKAGGEITADIQNSIWAYLPPGAIAELSRLDSVWSMSAARPTNFPK
jgi:hypothetical protein